MGSLPSSHDSEKKPQPGLCEISRKSKNIIINEKSYEEISLLTEE